MFQRLTRRTFAQGAVLLAGLTGVACTAPTTATPTATVEPTATATAVSTPQASSTPADNVPGRTLDDNEAALVRSFQEIDAWQTNFSKRTVPLAEIENLLPRDRITPVDEPAFAPVSEAPGYMRPEEPVISLDIEGDARAYPLAILMWHEIVNDTVGGRPVTITFCPLCNSAISFDRVVDGRELTFGTTGNLRHSDLVMWDRQTESWWQQITGEAIVGEFAGTRLELVPSAIIAWETFAEQFPDGSVLLRETDRFGQFRRPYNDPPYAGYDDINTSPFAFTGEVDGRLPATARVLTVEQDGHSVAYPFTFLQDARVVNDRVGDTDLVVFFDDGTLSPFLDDSGDAQTSGSTTVFVRRLDDRLLTFESTPEGLRDVETGSMWSLTGTAVSGPLAGEVLEPIVHGNHFWFAWAVFSPETEIRTSPGGSLEG